MGKLLDFTRLGLKRYFFPVLFLGHCTKLPLSLILLNKDRRLEFAVVDRGLEVPFRRPRREQFMLLPTQTIL